MTSPVNRYLPYLRLEHAGEQGTIRHLTSHTAGLGRAHCNKGTPRLGSPGQQTTSMAEATLRFGWQAAPDLLIIDCAWLSLARHSKVAAWLCLQGYETVHDRLSLRDVGTTRMRCLGLRGESDSAQVPVLMRSRSVSRSTGEELGSPTATLPSSTAPS